MTENSTALDNLKAHIDILQFCKAKQAEYADMVARSRAAIEEAMGGSEVGTVEGQPVVRYKYVKTNRLNQKALKDKRPDIVAEYTEATESRRFEVI